MRNQETSDFSTSNPDSKHLILIVDDEPQIRDLLMMVFQDRGCNTLEAENGVQALELVLSRKPDAVVSDVRMPGGGGIELLSKIVMRGLRLPFFLISGFSDISSEQARRLGAQALFLKPFNTENLVTSVLEALPVLSEAGRGK